MSLKILPMSFDICESKDIAVSLRRTIITANQTITIITANQKQRGANIQHAHEDSSHRYSWKPTFSNLAAHRYGGGQQSADPCSS
ncbi:hypothetical protein AVEN_86890-1 [Araneus ventricosus]|uniref:Uncharacterized protein n=1 Tax=Araneus ventricosus TaxID=182803 RepID=A0A4Y2WNB3_ARAVE|nr:hypothetical protein AVEN_86890-1 [Araneus ventricosus]